MSETYLITGGAGFIGSHFVKHLYEQEPESKLIILDILSYAGNLSNLQDVIGDKSRVQFWQGDVNDVELVQDLVSKATICIHFAAETHVARSLYANRNFFMTDVLGTQSICNAVHKYSERIKRLIHVSTSEVYGTSVYEPMDEEHPLNPTTPYAAAKLGADRVVYSYIKTYGIPAVVVRPFNNYGPKQHLEKAVPRFITQALMDEPITIHSNGDARRDWVWVGDTVNAIADLIKAPAHEVIGQIFNIGTGRSVSVLEIAQLICDILTVPLRIERVQERWGQVQNHYSSVKKLTSVINYQPQVKLEDGLYQTVRWYKSNKDFWYPQRPLCKVPIQMKTGELVYW